MLFDWRPQKLLSPRGRQIKCATFLKRAKARARKREKREGEQKNSNWKRVGAFMGAEEFTFQFILLARFRFKQARPDYAHREPKHQAAAEMSGEKRGEFRVR